MFTTIIVRNTAIENVTFTPNVVVLAKQTTSVSRNGNVNTTLRYIECGNVADTKEISAIKTLLSARLAQFRYANGFNADYGKVNENLNSGISASDNVKPFLSTNVILRTDSDGKISKAVISDIPLNKTALVLNKSHAICTTTGANLKAAIHNHAKAILAQSKISTELQTIVDAINKEIAPKK